MKRVLSCGAVALLLVVSAAADASAQGKFSGFMAVGPTTTTGDLKDADSTKSGFMAQAGFEYKLSPTLWLRADASMGWNDRVTNFAEDTNTLYKNLGGMLFSDATVESGASRASPATRRSSG